MPDGGAVAIQGEAGSFSHAAALKIHGREVRLIPCATFTDLLSAHPLHVVAETELRIRHCLIAPPRTRLPDVRRVASHPVALAQCRRFFTTHPDLVAVPAYDTAGSVRDLMAGKADAEAAIASRLAAELYGAAVLEEGLEDHAENYTRFLVVARDPAPRKQANKTSLILSLGNTPGTLHRALGVFAARGLNLTKIESRPLPGRPWEYLFYLDVVDSGQGIGPAIEELRAFTSGIRILGTYPAR